MPKAVEVPEEQHPAPVPETVKVEQLLRLEGVLNEDQEQELRSRIQAASVTWRTP